MQITRLVRRLITMKAMRRATAASVRVDRRLRRLGMERTPINLPSAKQEIAEVRDWCVEQLQRLIMAA